MLTTPGNGSRRWRSFRTQFLDPYTSDDIVDHLRSAAKGMVEGETHDDLAKAGDDLAAAAQKPSAEPLRRLRDDPPNRGEPFANPATGEEIAFDKGRPGESGFEGRDHYHRPNPNLTGKRDANLDANGDPVPRGSTRSRILPWER